MRELSLFSGAGGGLLATKHLLGWRTMGYVEWNEHCQRVIAQRIRDGYLDDAPIYGDIRAFIDDGYADAYAGMVDVVTGGFPCQPYSSAAHGRNRADSTMQHMLDAIAIVKPRYVFLENVQRGPLERVAMAIGYPGVRLARVSAASVAAPHLRRRWWLLADADGNGEPACSIDDEARRQSAAGGAWSEESLAGALRVAHGVAHRVERIRAIGNGQVPLVAATAWRLLSGMAESLDSRQAFVQTCREAKEVANVSS